MRRALLVGVLVISALSCGGPSPNAPSPSLTINLTSGPHHLTVTVSTTPALTCSGSPSVCTGILFCIGAITSSRAVIPVDLTRSGDTVTLQPSVPLAGELFQAQLQITNNAIDGMLRGTARDASGVFVSFEGDAGAIVRGAPSTGGVSGTIDGMVRIGGSGCSTNSHTWTLQPR